MQTLFRRSFAPSARDAAIARAAKEALSKYAGQPLTVYVHGAELATPIDLPSGVITLLLEILEVMGSGRGATVIPETAELTTTEAADVLNVSRPYVIKLLNEGKIPYHMVGTHRRIQLDDLLAYKEKDDQEREAAFDELVRLSQEMGMYPRP